jgi:hydroxymethylpyrimidine/phosphomethylpyrimidine kinase
VRGAYELPAEWIRAQMEAVLDDFEISAAKTGMLSSVPIIETVAEMLEERGLKNLVVDPVMVSKSGYRLLRDDAVTALKSRLLPMARVVTPNLHEASLLAGYGITSLDDMAQAARDIGSLGARAVVVKGGHASFALAVDVLFSDGKSEELHPDGAVGERSVHGTGCTFSAAIAARLAHGDSVRDAVLAAKRYVTRVIAAAPDVGGGHPPGGHFYFNGPGDWES